MSQRAGFRQDIEGLRAVSVLAVVLWHAGLPWLPGGYVGVDVFFVISGFLMTTILVKELERDKTIRLGGFYARRARRLLPAALTALIGTALLTLTLLPSHRWPEIGRDIVASAAYVVNWTLASGSVDYLAQDEPPSPLQHFWSLAVEEQFYLVWPALLLLVPILFRGRLRQGVLALTTLTFLGSLAVSVQLTQSNPTVAYFITPTRMWELALGGLVALGAARWPHLRRWFAVVLGWTGLAMILLAVVTYSNSTPFPGYQALLPTVGAALVLIAGPAAGSRGPIVALRPAPMQFLGTISYSLYLWHWPFLVVAMERFGNGHSLPLSLGLATATLSVIPAWLSWKFVEEPVRLSGSRMPKPLLRVRSLRLGLNCSLTGLIVGTTLVLAAGPQPPEDDPTWVVPADVLASSGSYGAMVLGDNPTASPAGVPVDRVAATNPPLEAVAADRPVFVPQDCHLSVTATEPELCQGGDPQGDRLVVLVGDSHAAMWITALDAIGQSNGWRVGTMTKSSCPLVDGLVMTRSSKPYSQCTQWNDRMLEVLAQADPDLVLLSHAKYSVDSDEMAAGVDRAITQLEQQGIPVGVIRDVPRPEVSMSDCVSEHPEELTACAFPRSSGLERSGTGQVELQSLRPDLPFIDLTDFICPQEMCAPVIGGVPVYRDGNHLSATYVGSLATQLSRELEPLLEGSMPSRAVGEKGQSPRS